MIFWKPLVCHCVKYDSFCCSVWDEKKMASFELCVSSVLTQNGDIWNFHGSLILNKGKLIGYVGSLCYAIVSNMTHLVILFGIRKKNGLF